jgi:hypothetical protein
MHITHERIIVCLIGIGMAVAIAAPVARDVSASFNSFGELFKPPVAASK